ncbi:flavodoxin [Companilactobacillus sp. HBUAS59699]|uniref:flavodoxin n=1 Tax=Companilactobacillus sp. HBUAS59699 TaxID=3109358 RepID=UPI002FF08EC1
MKSIVIYFSESGNTKKAAEYIAEQTKSDIERLSPVKPYPKDYDKLVEVSGDELDNDVYPEIKNQISFDNYDTIYLGYPTWYHQAPMIIHSFFDKFDLKNKTVIPFTTTYSSPFSESEPFIKKMVINKGIELKRGFRANSNSEINKYFSK